MSVGKLEHLPGRIFFLVVLRLNADYGLLILDISRPYTMTHHSW